MTALEQQVKRYVRRWGPRLGLHQWDIGVALVDSLTNEAVMEVEPQTAYHRCELRVVRTLKPVNCPYHSIEYCVVHELVHVLMDPLVDIAWELLEEVGDLNPPARHAFERTYRIANEQTTEAVARLLWRHWTQS